MKSFLKAGVIFAILYTLGGCSSLLKERKPLEPVTIYTAEYKVNSSVDDNSIINSVIDSINSTSPNYVREYKSSFSSNNSYNPGTTKVYVVKGWITEVNKYDQITISYHDGKSFEDSREPGSPSIHGFYKTINLNVNITNEEKSLKKIEISNSKFLLESSDENNESSMSKEMFLDLVQFKIKNIKMQFPTQKTYTGTITLKNDDVTAYANIQRNFSDSFFSTNNKNDSEKSGEFKTNGNQKVNFQIYPYKKVSKLSYKFDYQYFYNEKGGSDFDEDYPTSIINMITKEFNK
ncbi:hypothetical protein [Marinomonas sp.]|uniref:hypothetical protein n=1 Tax=Marinomonas sp. TaxID=1904862 RepID=UPI003BAB87B8